MLMLLRRPMLRSKLIAAFVMMLTGTVALGLFSLSRVQHLNGKAAFVGRDLAASNALGRAALDGERLLSLGFARHAAPSNAEKATVAADFEATTADLERSWTRFLSSGIAAGQEQGLVAAERAAWDAFRHDLGEAADMDEAGSTDMAEAFLTTDTNAACSRFGKAIDAIVTFQERQGVAAVDTAARLGRSTARMILSVLLGLAIGCGLVGWLIIRAICRPITEMTDTMRRLAGRELLVAIPGADRRDEIGAMAAAVAVFRDGMIEAERLAAEQQTERATRERRAAALDTSIANFKSKAGTVAEALAVNSVQLKTSAGSMTSTAAETSQRAVTVAASAEEASASVQSAAVASEQLAATIAEIGRQVAVSTTISGKAVADSRRTDSIVRALAEAADKIGQVVGLISNIASQTSTISTSIAAAVEQQGAATSEIARNVQRTAEAARNVTTIILGVTHASKEAGAAAGHMRAAADAVSGQAEQLSAEVNDFLTQVKAA